MAKVIGKIERSEMRKRIRRTKAVRYRRDLKVPFGTLLKQALSTGYARS